jgi:hypothetical protein
MVIALAATFSSQDVLCWVFVPTQNEEITFFSTWNSACNRCK